MYLEMKMEKCERYRSYENTTADRINKFYLVYGDIHSDRADATRGDLLDVAFYALLLFDLWVDIIFI